MRVCISTCVKDTQKQDVRQKINIFTLKKKKNLFIKVIFAAQ